MKDKAVSTQNSMHLQRIQELVKRFEGDSRCLAMYLSGSLAKGTSDEYSDVDMGIVVADEHYDLIRAELPAICEAELGKLAAWLPEAETADWSSYAFLCHQGQELLLYDLAVTPISNWKGTDAAQVLFDRTGRSGTATEETAGAFDANRLAWLIKHFWVYMYLNGKYVKRSDIYKMLYIQGVLFQAHLGLLHALQPGHRWHWWPQDVQSLAIEHQDRLLVYFGAADLEGLAAAIASELDLFSKDASTICKQWGMEYPAVLEQGVRRHLEAMAVVSATDDRATRQM